MTEQTLFHEALAKEPAQRAAFLNAACAGQTELRVAVEALLAAHGASASLLDEQARADEAEQRGIAEANARNAIAAADAAKCRAERTKYPNVVPLSRAKN